MGFSGLSLSLSLSQSMCLCVVFVYYLSFNYHIIFIWYKEQVLIYNDKRKRVRKINRLKGRNKNIPKQLGCTLK